MTEKTNIPVNYGGFRLYLSKKKDEEISSAEVWSNLCKFEGSKPEVQITLTLTRDVKAGDKMYLPLDHDDIVRINALEQKRDCILKSWVFEKAE